MLLRSDRQDANESAGIAEVRLCKLFLGDLGVATPLRLERAIVSGREESFCVTQKATLKWWQEEHNPCLRERAREKSAIICDEDPLSV
jgi:hypothetical protein